ncbi:hypothetical protein TNCV_4118361 [Trichonephila clavipes]|nr:hypothetical protein TNCV_4118361 [Trichonephila clavipes]
MRYDRTLRHTSSVRCIETLRSIFAVTLSLVRSNLWDAQLAFPNGARYARLETNLGIDQAKKGLLVQDTTPNGGVYGWVSKAAHVTNVLQTGAFVWFKKTQVKTSDGAICAWMMADEAVGCTRVFLTMWWSSR